AAIRDPSPRALGTMDPGSAALRALSGMTIGETGKARIKGREGAMKRSEVNQILRNMDAFLQQKQFPLPPFAYWSPEAWKKKGPEVSEIVDRRLGWDITDFGQNDFCKCGLGIFTLRNGVPGNTDHTKGKVYCEKVLMFLRDQICPFHFHWIKMEDIINRGGGELVVQVCNADPADGLAHTPATLSIDGTLRTVDARTDPPLDPVQTATPTTPPN